MSTRSYFSTTINEFLATDENAIIGEMALHHPFDLNDLTKSSWLSEIRILKRELKDMGSGHVSLEFKIPRMGKRVDAVVVFRGILFLLEFKDGDTEYRNSTFKQVMDYALDLKNFHKGSRDKLIVPIAVPTEAPLNSPSIQKCSDGVFQPFGVNQTQIGTIIRAIEERWAQSEIDYESWENAEYMPTPTIVEAAQALYNNHNVLEITRSDAGAQNLNITTNEIKRIVEYSKTHNRKSIIFVTGVPGAGKTLVGLNLASEYHDNELEEHAVFLSGNLPLVTVLQEALARDKVKREREENGHRISKDTALREVKTVIQIIHHYRDEYVGNNICPSDRVAIFDESQRAWSKDEISSFMARKKGVKNFNYSEPEFLIQTMDRHRDWAVIVCLVGGGQEINKGEAGLPEWFDALKRSFPHWDAYAAMNLDDSEYLRSRTWRELTSGVNLTVIAGLHLATSMRSFRSEKVSLLVKQILDNDTLAAKKSFLEIKNHYPIYITRDLDKAKNRVRELSRGNERYGLVASSTAARLRPRGIYYAKDRSSLSPESWFLNAEDDIRSSYFMEVVASEFETQGLELDYTIVAWDADFRIENGKWAHYQMSNRLTPPNWSRIKSPNNIEYLKNSYRVLLTRARQGFIIYIPEGVADDATRKPTFYDTTFDYLKSIGIMEI